MLGSIFLVLTVGLTALSSVAYDLARLLVLGMRSRRTLAAENLFLRKQLAPFSKSGRQSRAGPMIPLGWLW
jgi:hypothetical protein